MQMFTTKRSFFAGERGVPGAWRVWGVAAVAGLSCCAIRRTWERDSNQLDGTKRNGTETKRRKKTFFEKNVFQILNQLFRRRLMRREQVATASFDTALHSKQCFRWV